MTTSMQQAASRWERLGAMFNVAPARETPDIERLLLDTARLASRNSRLFILAASWLTSFGDFVAKKRLASLVHRELESEHRARMGLLLEWTQIHSHRNRARFRETIQHCTPAADPGPLADVMRRNAALRSLARQTASALSRRWGCWSEDFDVKHDALRTHGWIIQHNQILAARALCGGDLVASILAEAASTGQTFESESHLSRRFDASRAAIRDALQKLKLAGLARQTVDGKNHPITISLTPPLKAA